MKEKSFSKYLLLKPCLGVCNAGMPERLDLHVGGTSELGPVSTVSVVPSSNVVLWLWWRSEEVGSEGLRTVGSTGVRAPRQACWSVTSIKHGRLLPHSLRPPELGRLEECAGGAVQPPAIQGLRNHPSGRDMLFPDLHLDIPPRFHGEAVSRSWSWLLIAGNGNKASLISKSGAGENQRPIA